VRATPPIPFRPILQQLDPQFSADISLNCITVDSRNAGPAALFVALPGTTCDGHDFVAAAIEQNCTAVLVQQGRVDLSACHAAGVVVLEVADTRKANAQLARLLYEDPSQGMTLFAVTGTNGKTSVSYLLESILHQAGRQPGVLGTINYRFAKENGKTVQLPSVFTTPEPMLLQQTLRYMADRGVDSVIMEVSSHGLEQCRLGGLKFDVAAFTNLSRDHLDYHKDMEHYFAAKMRLFTEHLSSPGTVVTTFPTADCPWSTRLLAQCHKSGITHVSCGAGENRDIFVESQSATCSTTELTITTPKGACCFSSPLLGSFNVSNLQTSMAMALAAGISIDTIATALGEAKGAPGRMQRVAVSANEEHFLPTVIVDYAHTPDALKQVLKVLRTLTEKRLISVFGCGGDRDSGKRAMMGAIADQYADLAIVTSDNPRTEDPQGILHDVAAGFTSPLRNISWLDEKEPVVPGYVCIADRKVAIATAISNAGPGDMVLIAGKGHEQYQITRQGKRFFDDRLEAVTALCQWRVQSLIKASSGNCLRGKDKAAGLGIINTDSRTIAKGDVFLALSGDRFDGHDYVDQVVAAGASALIVQRLPESSVSVPVIRVADTERALGDLAAYRRRIMRDLSFPKVLAITGSSGKTTVKEMCAAICAEQWPEQTDAASPRVLKTMGNFNNLIGLPLSLLPVLPSHKAVILEMGMNAPGEIARLTEIADPDIACILNVHGAHLQGLGSIEGVARAKAELFDGCSREALLVVNGDDPLVLAAAKKCPQKKIVFGHGAAGDTTVDIRASKIEAGSAEKIHFSLHVDDLQGECILQLPGIHNVSNALAAAAICWGAGIDISRIVKGLNGFTATERRMEIVDGPCNCRVINDSYNANPQSMEAGIQTLKGLGHGTRIAVLGDMLELGQQSRMLHEQIGRCVAQNGIDSLALIGEFAGDTAKAAIEQGMDRASVHTFDTKEACLVWMKGQVDCENGGPGCYFLVKGSRGMQLDKLVERFVGDK
jgi:murE/murF fusion protein